MVRVYFIICVCDNSECCISGVNSAWKSLFDGLENDGDGKCAAKKLTRLIQENQILRNWGISL